MGQRLEGLSTFPRSRLVPPQTEKGPLILVKSPSAFPKWTPFSTTYGGDSRDIPFLELQVQQFDKTNPKLDNEP